MSHMAEPLPGEVQETQYFIVRPKEVIEPSDVPQPAEAAPPEATVPRVYPHYSPSLKMETSPSAILTPPLHLTSRASLAADVQSQSSQSEYSRLSNRRSKYAAQREAEEGVLEADLEEYALSHAFATPKPSKLAALSQNKSTLDNRAKSSSGIEAEPPRLLIKDYRPNEVYRETIVLRNRSLEMCQFTIVGPQLRSANAFFKAVLRKGADGKESHTLAPGVEAKIDVEFRPNALANFTDVITVKNSLHQSFDIPLVAERWMPVLEGLPTAFQCGACRAGTQTSRQWTLHNTGGRGKFSFVRPVLKESIIEPSFWEEWQPDSSELTLSNAFRISPASFFIEHDEKVTVTVRYDPAKVEAGAERSDSAQTLLGSDNCQYTTLDVAGVGQRANVQYSGPQELSFSEVNPGHQVTQEVILFNPSSVLQTYKWVLSDDVAPTTGKVRLSLPQHAFSITPETGMLSAGENAFTITFHPQKDGSFAKQAEFVLINEDGSRVIEPGLNTIRLDLFGQCSIPIVQFDPPTWLQDQTLPLGEVVELDLLLRNLSVSEQHVALHYAADDPDLLQFTAQPSHMSMPPQSTAPVRLQVVAHALGTLSATLTLRYAHAPPLTLTLSFCGVLREGAVAFQHTEQDYGLLQTGTLLNDELWVENTTSVSLQAFFDVRASQAAESVRFLQQHVFLAPMSMTCVGLHIHAYQRDSDVSAVVSCSIKGVDHSLHAAGTTLLKYRTAQPAVRFLEADAMPPISIYAGVQSSIRVSLQNTSPLPATFSLTAKTIASSLLVVQPLPNRGAIAPYETIDLLLTLKNQRAEAAVPVELLCDLETPESQSEPAVLSFAVACLGSSLSWSTGEGGLDFGQIEVDKAVTKQIQLKNTSGTTTPFALRASLDGAHPDFTVTASPKEGTLAPWSSTTVSVTVKGMMWGEEHGRLDAYSGSERMPLASSSLHATVMGRAVEWINVKQEAGDRALIDFGAKPTLPTDGRREELTGYEHTTLLRNRTSEPLYLQWHARHKVLHENDELAEVASLTLSTEGFLASSGKEDVVRFTLEGPKGEAIPTEAATGGTITPNHVCIPAGQQQAFKVQMLPHTDGAHTVTWQAQLYRWHAASQTYQLPALVDATTRFAGPCLLEATLHAVPAYLQVDPPAPMLTDASQLIYLRNQSDAMLACQLVPQPGLLLDKVRYETQLRGTALPSTSSSATTWQLLPRAALHALIQLQPDVAESVLEIHFAQGQVQRIPIKRT